MVVINLDGVRIQVLPPDIDKDGKTGGIEKIQRSVGDDDVHYMKQSSELGDSLDIAFSDKFNPQELVSDVDLKANLHPVQIPYLAIFDSLCRMSFLNSKGLGLSRQIKRLSVSEKSKSMGVGRKNIVDMVTGKREFDRDTGDKTRTIMAGEMKR